jgi:hypothetical protein
VTEYAVRTNKPRIFPDRVLSFLLMALIVFVFDRAFDFLIPGWHRVWYRSLAFSWFLAFLFVLSPAFATLWPMLFRRNRPLNPNR